MPSDPITLQGIRWLARLSAEWSILPNDLADAAEKALDALIRAGFVQAKVRVDCTPEGAPKLVYTFAVCGSHAGLLEHQSQKFLVERGLQGVRVHRLLSAPSAARLTAPGEEFAAAIIEEPGSFAMVDLATIPGSVRHLETVEVLHSDQPAAEPEPKSCPPKGRNERRDKKIREKNQKLIDQGVETIGIRKRQLSRDFQLSEKTIERIIGPQV